MAGTAGELSVWVVPGAQDRLVHLWCFDRKSAGQIAEVMNLEYGVALTRSAVLGRVRRAGLLGKGGQPRSVAKAATVAKAARAANPPARRGTVTLAGGYGWRDGGLFREGRA